MENTGGLTAIDLVVLAVYLTVMLAMGFYIALRQRSTDDFFIAGRSLPAWAVGISLLASLLSTISYLGTPGEMFRSGLAYMSRQLGVPIVLLVVWLLWLPFFVRLKLTSAYEYLERRFNYPTRLLGSVLCIMLLLGWMAVVVLTASRAMSEIANFDLAWFFGSNAPGERDADMHAIILGIGLFSVVYTTLGGIRAVVWTDVIQFFVLMGGAVFTMVFIAWQTNSNPGDWIQVANQYELRETVQWFDWDLSNRSTVFFISINMVFWFICTHGANQVALQRYFSVRNVRQARISYLVNAVASIALTLILAFVGIALMYYIEQPNVTLPAEEFLHDAGSPNLETARDNIFPQFIRYYLPQGLRGLVVAALFAAAMSTIDSGANSISTIVTVDFVRPFRGGKQDARAELKLARMLTAGMGIAIIALTVGIYHMSKGTDIVSLMQKGFNCFLGPLGGLFVLGMFSKRATAGAVIPAVLIGETFGIVSSYMPKMFSTYMVVPMSWLVTVLSGLILAHILNLFGIRASTEQQQWCWLPVVRRAEKVGT